MKPVLAVTFVLALSGFAGQEGRRQAKDYPKDGVYWSKSWMEAAREASGRNVPIFIAFHKDGSADCDTMAAVYREKSFIDRSRLWVNVIVHPGIAHDVDVEIDGKKVARCERYFNVTCRDHDGPHAELNQRHKVGPDRPTRVYFVSSQWKELGRDTGAMKVNDLVKAMDKFHGQLEGEKIHADHWRKAEALEVEGDQAFTKKEWQKAIKAYRAIAELGPKSLESRSRTGLNKVNLQGELLHTKAFDSQPKGGKGEFKETKRILREIIRDFKSLPIAEKAQSYLTGLEKHGH